MSQSKFSILETEHHDQITVNWIIPNFKQSCDLQNPGEIFSDKFVIRGSRWGFNLDVDRTDVLGLYLRLYGYGSFSAKFSVHLKSSSEWIPSGNSPLCKYRRSRLSLTDSDSDDDIDDDGADTGRAWGIPSWKSLSELQNKGFLSKDELCLRLTVDFYSSNSKGPLKSKLSEDFKKRLDSGIGTDVIFKFVEVGDDGSSNVIAKVKAHREFLISRSSYFAAMFASGMKEALKDGEVEISDMSPKAFKILLNYIYSGEVQEEWGAVAEELLYGADKYELAELQKYLCQNIHSVLTARNVWKISKLAKLQDLSRVKESTVKFIEKNARDVLENVDDVILKKKKKLV